jgi:sensor histidine kinase YesM
VERYIAIVGLQLEERLRFTLDIPARLHGCLVPPLLLQMLVENAVKHGIEPLRGGGQVTLSAREHEGGLQFVVANDQADSLAGGSGGEGLGIGIRNIEQRLALLYGTDATHAVRDANGRYEVLLTIPKEAAQ